MNLTSILSQYTHTCISMCHLYFYVSCVVYQCQYFQCPGLISSVCFMIDGMNIRKQLIYNQQLQRMEGYVDLGAGPQEDGREASEALVFMVTGSFLLLTFACSCSPIQVTMLHLFPCSVCSFCLLLSFCCLPTQDLNE